MADPYAAFSGSIPETYDRYLGPLLFEPYAADLATRLAANPPATVLEIAAGTGIVTRALAHALPQASLTATDLNQAMLDHAARQVANPRITWKQADAQALPFADKTFDAVVCQFGVMFFPDKRGAFREALRVLRPKGRLLFNVWDRIEQNALSQAVQDWLNARYPADPPQFLVRAPFGYFDAAVIMKELETAGFTQVVVTTLPKRSQCPSARDAAQGLCQGSPLRAELESREPAGLSDATNAAAQAIAKRFGAGPVDAPMQAHVFSAIRSW